MSTKIGFLVQASSGGGTGSDSGVDASITTWAQLAAIPTAGIAVPIVKVWIEAATLAHKVTQLRAGTDATDTANGIQRPDDYAAGNQKVWYQA